MITPEQREERRDHIGSSDSPKITEVSPFGGPLAVYVEKVDATPQADKPWQRVGNLMEETIGRWMAQELGYALPPSVRYVLDGTPFAANCDFACDRRGEAWECKNVGGEYRDDWGEPDTDQVPDYVMVQVQHQMMVCPALRRVVVGCSMPNRFGIDFHMYYVEPHAALQAMIFDAGMDFWTRHVIPRVPPLADEGATLAQLKRLPRVRKEVPVNALDVLRWAALRELRLAVEKREESAAATIVAALGDADAGVTDVDGVSFRYGEVVKTVVDMERLRASGLLSQFQRESRYRMLSPTLPKGARAVDLLRVLDSRAAEQLTIGG